VAQKSIPPSCPSLFSLVECKLRGSKWPRMATAYQKRE
jgi:hypothetical protein